MTSDGQKDKVGDYIPAGSEKHVAPNVEEDGRYEETQNQNHGKKDVGQDGDVPKKPNRSGYYNKDDLQVWKDRCLRRDKEVKEMANKLTDLQLVVNFMMQNNVMQPPFPLQATPILAANAQKGGQKPIPIAPQHTRNEKHSHRPSREVGRGESMK